MILLFNTFCVAVTYHQFGWLCLFSNQEIREVKSVISVTISEDTISNCFSSDALLGKNLTDERWYYQHDLCLSRSLHSWCSNCCMAWWSMLSWGKKWKMFSQCSDVVCSLYPTITAKSHIWVSWLMFPSSSPLQPWGTTRTIIWVHKHPLCRAADLHCGQM